MLINELDTTTIRVIHAIGERTPVQRQELAGGERLGEHVLTFDAELLLTDAIAAQAWATPAGQPFWVAGYRPAVRAQKGMGYEALIQLARADGAFSDILAALYPDGPRQRLSPLAG